MAKWFGCLPFLCFFEVEGSDLVNVFLLYSVDWLTAFEVDAGGVSGETTE